MNLTKREKEFVERRAKLVQYWPILGTICLAGVLILAVWLWLSRPFLINPWKVLSGLEAGSIPESTTLLMAAMLPIVVLACLFVLVACLIFCFAAFSNERKHLDIINRFRVFRGDSNEET